MCLKGFPLWGKGICPACQREIGGCVPAHYPDGRLIKLMYHKETGQHSPPSRFNRRCWGVGMLVPWTVKPGKHTRDREENADIWEGR